MSNTTATTTSAQQPQQEKKESKVRKVALEFSYGAISSALTKAISQPIERVKLVAQVEQNGKQQHDAAQLLQEYGNTSLLLQNAALNITRYCITQSCNLTLKSRLNKLFPAYHPKREYLKHFTTNVLKGAIAGVVRVLQFKFLTLGFTHFCLPIGYRANTHAGHT